MKKILLTFVGEQDPVSEKTDSEGAIVTLAKKIHPDLVFMLPTKRMPGTKSQTESHAEETIDWLTDAGITKDNIYICPLPLADPRNIPEILELGRAEIKHILDSLPASDEVELSINTSSGTPQMQSCWYIWANSGFFAPCQVALYQVGDPRYVAEEDRVEEVRYEFMEETNTVERIGQYLDAMLFQVAAEEAQKLSQISCYSNRRMKADVISPICQAYHQWDLLNYSQAMAKLRSVVSRYDDTLDLAELVRVLKEQLEALSHLNNADQESIYNLTDIYYNAQRRFRQNGYADTLARIWRLIEGCLFYRLRSQYKIEPRDIGSSANKEGRDNIVCKLQAHKELSFAKSTQALERVLEDTKFIAFEKRKETLPWGDSNRQMTVSSAMEQIRKVRNESIVAHGIKPVSKEVAQLSLEIGRLFLEFTFKKQDFVEAYPFKGSESRNIMKELLY